ncbi:class I SAM-dependent methyltransferase [Desulfosporosinus meridiei]|uniref:Methylase involved in ubiquinone/menaquinone biosynthesis n=1 Tax=Desulfosporosinus meridiei (strain ATCC BAA-275 / DSM 13257 / KCTC 12902 / NCIMB 13706 / S10) TaxID=768704 RepID=J7IV48_DESMD|nr:class I SAM-dependent methyltransferase [Desulfosporosinus meridiei]AFQ42581.1 methylase involved in ubiquinone/menaquinone biosynthesis [Desulfosporosinus meridiei DSM 13257]
MEMYTRIKNYWEGEASRYSEGIWKEMNSFKKQAWAELIEHYRPRGNPLKVLDIGTGPGFFAMLAAEMGHIVTATDCTQNMLLEAQNNIRQIGLQAEFLLMDSHELSFADNSFDLILCRNLTWTLYNPLAAYKEWQRVLKRRGRLLIFDANWNLRLNDPERQAQYLADMAEAERRGIHRRGHVDPEEGDRIAKDLFLSTRLRPHWDAGALIDLGFKEVFINTDITNRTWDEEDKILYKSTPMFLVGGEK